MRHLVWKPRLRRCLPGCQGVSTRPHGRGCSPRRGRTWGQPRAHPHSRAAPAATGACVGCRGHSQDAKHPRLGESEVRGLASDGDSISEPEGAPTDLPRQVRVLYLGN